MNDEEIMQSAENVRLAEIKLISDREQRKHEKWQARHDTIHGIFHPDSDTKGFAYMVLFIICLLSAIPVVLT